MMYSSFILRFVFISHHSS